MGPYLGFINHNTVLHRLDPVLKLVALCAVTVGVLVYSSWFVNALILIVLIIMFRVAKTGIGLASKRVKFLLFFSIFLVLLQVLVTPNGIVLFYLLPGPALPVTTFGLDRGLSLALRFLLIVFSSILFVSVTDPSLLAQGLTRVRVPYRYSFMLVVALRFLPLFESENHSVRLAQKSRGIEPDVRSVSGILRTARYTFFPLLVSALSRVDSLAMSMDGRGFGFAKERTFVRRSTWGTADTLFSGLVFVYLIMCLLLASGLVALY